MATNKIIKYYYNNKDRKASAEYWENGQYHCLDGPAYTSWYYNTSSIQSIVYMINGKYHREDGPAYQHFDRDGILLTEEYCLNDIRYSKKEWEIRTRKSKLNKLNRCEED